VEFIDAAFGVIGLETALPLALELARSGLITLSRLVELMSLNPARILGVPGGTLAPGQPADVTVVDQGLGFTLEPSGSRSLSRNSPFWGRPLMGRATHTIVEGRVVYELEPQARAG
jgi:dihydroorotase